MPRRFGCDSVGTELEGVVGVSHLKIRGMLTLFMYMESYLFHLHKNMQAGNLAYSPAATLIAAFLGVDKDKCFEFRPSIV